MAESRRRKIVLAKALYDNDSEEDDELSFKKGDVVKVLETDFEGMAGWWLCVLGDKQGVAPGNRLQILSYLDLPSDDPNEIYDTPMNAYKVGYGDVDYDVPKPHKLSPSEYQDYAIPKSPYSDIPVSESQRHGFVLPSPRVSKHVNMRNSNSSDGLISNDVYDAPPRWSSERSSDEFRFSGEIYPGSGPEEIYDMPSGSPVDDGGRTGQRGDLTLRVPVILPPSWAADKTNQGEGSGLQVSEEIYDTPANVAQDVYDVLPTASDIHGDVYDHLPLANDGEIYDVPPAPSDDIYDVPPSGEPSQPFYESIDFVENCNNNPPASNYYDEITMSDPGGEDEMIYDVPQEKGVAGRIYDNFDISEMEKELKEEEGEARNRASPHGDKKAREQSESDDYVDYQEIYGLGQEQPENKQVGEKQEETPHGVLNRINMEKVQELKITRSVAMKNLDKLQQAVDVAVTKLLSFLTEDWRQPDVLRLNINGIREISGKVKVAVRLLTEFGLGALVNSKKLSDDVTYRKISDALEPLLETYYSIKSAIQRLDETEWKSTYQMHDDDDLNSIVKLAQGIPCDAYNIGAVLSNISSLLFSKTPDNIHSGPAHHVTKARPPSQNSFSSSSPASAQKESVKGLEVKKVESQSVEIQAKHLVLSENTEKKLPPKISQKPKRDQGGKKQKNSPVSGEERSFSNNVSELTNNLLNQIEDIETPTSGLRRKPSKKLSPKTVRRLCSIGLKDDHRNGGSILEDVISAPPKPSRNSSSSADPSDAMLREDTTSVEGEGASNNLDMFGGRKILWRNLSEPGIGRSLPSVNSENCKSDGDLSRSIKEGALFTDKKSDKLEEHVVKFGKPRRDKQEEISPIEKRDSKNFQRLESFVEKMDNQFVILKEGIKSFGESVRECQEPKVFVSHSKFIVLSAHKLVYVGDGASRSITSVGVRNKISEVSNSLSEVINNFVENIKVAARQYPNEAAMNVMIKGASKVTETAVELYKILKEYSES